MTAFDGTVIVVSHDRYFLNRVVDLLLVLDGRGGTQVVHGNYDTYELMRAQQEAAATAGARANGEDATASRERERPEGGAKKEKRKRKFPYRKTAEIEDDIAAAEAELRELEGRMASPELYRDGDKVKETTKAFEEVKAELARLYEHWEEAVEMN